MTREGDGYFDPCMQASQGPLTTICETLDAVRFEHGDEKSGKLLLSTNNLLVMSRRKS